MAAFNHLDWRRIDVRAIVGFAGLATIEPARHELCREWLRRNKYTITTLDCSHGLNKAVVELGELLNWQAQFGYSLDAESRNLDALRDGFVFDVEDESGLVFEILGAEIAWHEDPGWFFGLLDIAQEHSRQQLALGKRFFILLALADESPLIGAVITETKVPHPFQNLMI